MERRCPHSRSSLTLTPTPSLHREQTCGLESEACEEQLKIWKSEQHHIASQVVVRDDDDWINSREAVSQEEEHNSNDDSHTNATTSHAARFKRLPRLGTKRALYGGVDVSFPQDDSSAPSVATYVILEATTTSATTTLSVVYQDFMFFDLTISLHRSYWWTEMAFCMRVAQESHAFWVSGLASPPLALERPCIAKMAWIRKPYERALIGLCRRSSKIN
jgi:hypothetical protein